MSMNDEQFEQELQFLSTLASPPLIEQLRARDTDQREALAQMKTERDQYDELHLESIALAARYQQQLAEVLYILDHHRAWTGMGWEQLPVPVHAVEKIRSKLAQAEQQEVQYISVQDAWEAAGGNPGIKADREQLLFALKTLDQVCDEAQGAQAGDERAAFEDEFDRRGFELDRLPSGAYLIPAVRFGWEGWQARSALATQPAVPASVEAMSFEYAHFSGERRTVSITREDVIEGMEDALYEKLSDQICRCEPIGETNVVECNCQDYVEEFTLVSAKPAVRGAEHE